MKKLFTISMFFLAMFITFNPLMADSKRMTLLEEATNASCGPCAANNPALQAWLGMHTDEVIPLMYHASWPGSNDPMYLEDPAMNTGRIQYYGINGVPTAVVNGTKVNVTFTSQKFDAELNKVSGKTSPYDIIIEHTKQSSTGTIKITVKTSQGINGLVLRTALAETWDVYGAGVAGTNGETDFPYVARKMFPDQAGTVLQIPAGGQQTFTFQYSSKSKWNMDELYAVAWIQNDQTKEVMQAATDLKRVAVDIQVQNKYLKMDNTAEGTKVTISNSSDQGVTVQLAVDNDNSVIPPNWTAKLSKTSVFVPAKGSIDVDLTVTPGANKAFAFISITANPVVAGTMGIPDEDQVYAMSNGVEKVTLTGAAYYLGLFYTPIATHSFSQGMVPVMLSEEVLANFDFSKVKFLVLPIDAYSNGVLSVNSGLNTRLFALITRIMNEQGRVFIMDENSLAIAFNEQYGTPAARSFFENTLGINMGQGVFNLLDTQQGQLYSIGVKGVAQDPISNGMNYVINSAYSQSYPVYSPAVEIINIKNAQNVTPIFRYDNSQTGNPVAGVKIEKDGARAVYLGFGVYPLTQAEQQQVIVKIIDWLAQTIVVDKPEIVVNKSTIEYGQVELGKSKDQQVQISNTGKADLVITGLSFFFNDDESFKFVDAPQVPKTLAPGAKLNLTINFSPKAKQEYAITGLEIKSNDDDNSTMEVALKGEGIEPSSVYETGSSAFNMTAMPNEFDAFSTLSFTLGEATDMNVEIYMIDVAGNKVLDLVKGVYAHGNYTAEINASTLASGKYFIIAKSGSSYYQSSVIVK